MCTWKDISMLAAYQQPPQCTFELIPPAFVCLLDKTSQQCLEKSLMRDHCLHNKARASSSDVQPSLSTIYISDNLWKRVKYGTKVCFYVVWSNALFVLSGQLQLIVDLYST